MTDYDKGWNDAIEAAMAKVVNRSASFNKDTSANPWDEVLAAGRSLEILKKPVPPPRNCACRGDGDGKFTVHTPNSCWDGMRLP